MVSRFERRARRWQSVTPLALPMARRRRVDPGRQAEQAKGGAERAAEEGRAVAAVHHALRHAGIGVPISTVRVQREPFERQGALQRGGVGLVGRRSGASSCGQCP